jgi:phospholipase C
MLIALILSGCQAKKPTVAAPPLSSASPIIPNPCVGDAAPAQWQHVIVLIFENKKYDEVIGQAPYITSLANKCATVLDWKDADTRVDGSRDGKYSSKPSYATLTSGLSPSVHGLVNNSYESTTNVDNIYNQLNLSGLTFKNYHGGGEEGCKVRFNGDYHDALRYYDNVAAICDEHDVPLSTFLSDLEDGNLPAFSMLLPSNDYNMHDNSVYNGDEYAQIIMDAILVSPAYANGDLAVFLLWDENSPIPNVLVAPSIVAGTKISIEDGNPIYHFYALRTRQEKMGLPLLGDTPLAPSLLPFFNGH